MNELAKFEVYQKKLQGICDENDLTFSFRKNEYPITLTIKPCSGIYEQMQMLEAAEDDGYRSPDASIVFYIKDGDLMYKLSDKFSIGDALFGKIRNLFKNMHSLWCQYTFRFGYENNIFSGKNIPDVSEDGLPDEADPIEEFDDLDEDYDDEEVEDDADTEAES